MLFQAQGTKKKAGFVLKALKSRGQDFIFQVPLGPCRSQFGLCVFHSISIPIFLLIQWISFLFDYKLYEEEIILPGVDTAPGIIEVSILDKIQL